MSGRFNSIDAVKVGDVDQYIIEINKLPQAIDIALEEGKSLQVISKPSEDSNTVVIAVVGNLSDEVDQEYKGELCNNDDFHEGVFNVQIDEMISVAKNAKEKGFAFRILEKVENENYVQAQLIDLNAQRSFPQDFWLNRIHNAPDITSALMEVVQRRS